MTSPVRNTMFIMAGMDLSSVATIICRLFIKSEYRQTCEQPQPRMREHTDGAQDTQSTNGTNSTDQAQKTKDFRVNAEQQLDENRKHENEDGRQDNDEICASVSDRSIEKQSTKHVPAGFEVKFAIGVKLDARFPAVNGQKNNVQKRKIPACKHSINQPHSA